MKDMAKKSLNKYLVDLDCGCAEHVKEGEREKKSHKKPKEKRH